MLALLSAPAWQAMTLSAVCARPVAGGTDGLGTALRALSTVLVSYGPPVPRWLLQVLPLGASQALLRAQRKVVAAAQEEGQGLPLTLPMEAGEQGGGMAAPAGGVTVGGYQAAGVYVVNKDLKANISSSMPAY